MRNFAIAFVLILGTGLSVNKAFSMEQEPTHRNRLALLQPDDSQTPRLLKSTAPRRLMGDSSPIRAARPMLSGLKKPDPEMKLGVDKSFGKMPLRFEKNDGQTAEEVKFLSRGKGYTMYLTPTESVMALTKVIDEPKTKHDPTMDREPAKTETSVVRMEVVGGNPKANITGEEQLPGTSNYFIGNDQTKWRQAVPNYAKVRYEEVYPGIDLVYYGNQQKLEYDFVVKPGADPKQIALKFKGTENLSINAKGDLVLKTKTGKVIQHAPIIYQTIDNKKQPVEGSYRIDSDKVTFQLTQYDTNRDLVIDPVIGFSTYLGGSDRDIAKDLVLDDSGNIYVTGRTNSIDFDLLNEIEDEVSNYDIFVFKLAQEDNVPSLAFSTYLGGSDLDEAFSIDLDPAGNIYVAGATRSSDFDVLNEIEGATAGKDVVVFKLEQNGNIPALAFSTYLGGNDDDIGWGIAVDEAMNVYVVGETDSTDFDMLNEIAGDHPRGDAFVFKLEQEGNVPSLAFSTYLGGEFTDRAMAVALDGDGNIYVTGDSDSTDFPRKNDVEEYFCRGILFETTGNCPGFNSKVFVVKLEQASNVPSIAFSTVLGGSSDDGTDGDFGFDIALDREGNIYVAGHSDTEDFPTKNKIQGYVGTVVPPPGPVGSTVRRSDIVVFKMEQTGNHPTLVYSTYLGEEDGDNARSIAVDNSGNAYITGGFSAEGFSILALPVIQGYVFRISESNGVPAVASFTTFGLYNQGEAIALDRSANVYVAGTAIATDTLPLVNEIEGDSASWDTFVIKFIQDDLPDLVHNDFNADGVSDLLTLDETDGDIGAALLEDSVIQTHGEFLQLDPSEGWTLNASGDFNGDRKADLLFFNAITGAVGVARVDGTTLLDGAVVHTLDAAAGEVTRGTGDFDGDGKVEIIVQNLNTGELSFLFLDGDAVSSNEAVGQIDTSWNLVRTGDFNADGKTDLLFFKKATGEVALVEMDGATILKATIAFTLGTGWSIVDTGDFDGDNFSDVLVQNSSGEIALIFIEVSAIKSTEILGTLRAGWQVINAGHYDADNLADLLIQDIVTGDLLTVILKGETPDTHVITNLGTPPAMTVHSGKP